MVDLRDPNLPCSGQVPDRNGKSILMASLSSGGDLYLMVRCGWVGEKLLHIHVELSWSVEQFLSPYSWEGIRLSPAIFGQNTI